MAAERNGDLIEAMISPRAPRKSAHEAPIEADATGAAEEQGAATEEHAPRRPAKDAEPKSRLDVRPIGTTLGLKELAVLHRKTWSMLNVEEKRVHMMLWPLALHFGLYEIRPGQERKRPPLIGAFWARCLADAPLTLGHLYPPALFKGLYAADVWEFGGMVIEPSYQGKGLVKTLSDAAKMFLFSRRPRLIITNPVEPLYELYKQFGLKTVGNKPIEHPHAYNVKVWLMYGDFNELAKPYYM
jgi:GNAT superfamily N-acetyltransferase